MSNITPFNWKIYLLPIKKTVTSASGIILEEDRWELLTDTYQVMFDFWTEGKTIVLKAGTRVICSDAVGTNVIVDGMMMKVVDEKDILGTIS